MKRRHRQLLVGGVLLLGAGVAAWQYAAYAKERDRLEERIRAYTTDIQARNKQMEERTKLGRDLKTLAGTTFGADEERVTASFRKSLNEMIAHFGLIEASVTSARPIGMKNPAMEARVGEFTRLMTREQRVAAGAPDFYAISGTLNAKGTLEQALRVMATLQVQPWIHRVDGFSVRPVGKERQRVELTVMLATTYFSDPRLREKAEDPGWRPVREAEFAAWMPIVVKNVFCEPAPPAVIAAAASAPAPAPEQTAPPALPAAPAYEEWRISGVARGTGGPMLMLVNERTREWRTIDAGGMILDVKFVAGTGEVVELAIGTERFTVRAGQRLSERAKVQ